MTNGAIQDDTEITQLAAERDIRNVIDEVNQSLRERDAKSYVSAFLGDAVVFDLAPPLAHGIDQQGMEAWLETWDGPVERTCRDFVVSIDGDLAVAHGMYHVSATTKQGQTAAWWMRATVCLRQGPDWQIFHEHTSVPFYMDGSFKAAVDLQPS